MRCLHRNRGLSFCTAVFLLPALGTSFHDHVKRPYAVTSCSFEKTICKRHSSSLSLSSCTGPVFTSGTASRMLAPTSAAMQTRPYATSHNHRSGGGNGEDNSKNRSDVDDSDNDIFVKTSRVDDNDDDEALRAAARGSERMDMNPDPNADGTASSFGEDYNENGFYDSAEQNGEESDGNPTRTNKTTHLSSVGERRSAALPSLRTAYPPSGVELPESSFLKCIEKEMEDEKLRLDKEETAPPAPLGWELHHVKGSSVFYGRRMWIPPATRPVLTAPSSGHKKEKRNASSEQEASSSGDSDGDSSSSPRFPDRHERCMEKHFIRVQLTTRDAALDPECDIRGEHFPFSFFIQRVPLNHPGDPSNHNRTSTGETDAYSSLATLHAPTFDEAEELSMYENSIEVRLDVVDGELVVDAVVFHGDRDVLSDVNQQKLKSTLSAGTASEEKEEDLYCNAKTHRMPAASLSQSGGSGGNKKVAHYNNIFGGYPGPNLDEAEEEVLDGLQSWLAERHIDDRFGEFVGQYSVWVEQMEYESWLQQLHDYVAA